MFSPEPEFYFSSADRGRSIIRVTIWVTFLPKYLFTGNLNNTAPSIGTFLMQRLAGE
jgi:hypothetical protein